MFASGDEYQGDPKAPNRCYIPPTVELMSEDSVVFERAMARMRECGSAGGNFKLNEHVEYRKSGLAKCNKDSSPPRIYLAAELRNP